MPKFSLVIPTKNRSEILGLTLDHLLLQTFKDFECVVIDNDDTGATADSFNKRKLPSNFRLYRTGGLSMPNNWQTAVEQAHGDYIIILEDKTIIKNNLLAILNFIFTSKPDCMCVTWRQCVADFDKIPENFLTLKNPQISQIHCDELIHLVSSSNWPAFSTFAPRGFNCALNAKFALSSNSGSPNFRLCRPVSPDYTIAYQYVAMNETLVHLADPATIINAAAPSNGLDAHKKGALFKSFLSELGLSEAQTYESAPSKVFSVHNSLTADAIRIFKEFPKTKNFRVSLPEYYTNISYETIFRQFLGCDVRADVEQFQQEFQAFGHELRNQTLEYAQNNHIQFCQRWGIPNNYYSAIDLHLATFFGQI